MDGTAVRTYVTALGVWAAAGTFRVDARTVGEFAAVPTGGPEGTLWRFEAGKPHAVFVADAAGKSAIEAAR